MEYQEISFMPNTDSKPKRNTNIYEVVMYNKEVRQLVAIHESHPNFDDGWADGRYIEVPALNIRTVIKKIRSKYPRVKGFKILAIAEIPQFTFEDRERFS